MSELRTKYAFASVLFLVSASVSATPMEQFTRRDEGEENSGSLEQGIGDAVQLDKHIQVPKDQVSNNYESDDEGYADDENNDSRNRPSIRPTSSVSPTKSTALPDTLPTSITSSTTTSTTLPVAVPTASSIRSAAIVGGTIGSLILLAIIGLLLLRWRKNTESKIPWASEKYPQFVGPEYPQASPSVHFGGGASERTAPPTMSKPPSLVLVGNRSPPRDPEDRPSNNRTFFLESDSNHSSSNRSSSNRSSSLPPVYEELRSPGVESSISQTVPYPQKSVTRKTYASFVPPPPVPDAHDVMVSRFSWTTKRSSVDSEPRFRSINSWVNHQAGRSGVKEKLAQMGLEESAPQTPVAFKFHPGAPVSYGTGHRRMESEDLDRQLRVGR